MTAGTTTRSIGENRISLPRAGLGALLAATLLAGSVLGAAAYAGISAATGSVAADAAVVVAPMEDEQAAVTKAQIKAGNGPLVGDAPGVPAGPTASPSGRDRHAEITGHAQGHGPLE
jgi:hypothetical protein